MFYIRNFSAITKRIPLNRLLYPVFLLFLIILILTSRGWWRWHFFRKQIKELSKQNVETEKENQRLEHKISRLQYDDDYLAEISRRELELSAPQEVEYRIIFSSPIAKG